MDIRTSVKTENIIWFYDDKNEDSNTHNIKIENNTTEDHYKINCEVAIKEEKDDSGSVRSWDEDSMLLPDIKCEVVIDEYSTNALNEERHNNTSIKSINDNNVSCVPDVKEGTIENQSNTTNNQNVIWMLGNNGEEGDQHKSIKLVQSTLTGNNNTTIAKDKPYTCVICNKKFTTKNHVRRHMTIHSDEKPFACDLCSFRCRQKVYLTKHMRTHTGEKPYSCNYCTYRGALRTQLINHLRTHTGEKPYACELCPYRCAHPGDIKRHTRIHTGEKPYPCKYCPFRSATSGDILRHTRTHTGEKPYACRYCIYRSKMKCDITKHEKTCGKNIKQENTKEQQQVNDRIINNQPVDERS